MMTAILLAFYLQCQSTGDIICLDFLAKHFAVTEAINFGLIFVLRPFDTF